MRDTGKKTIGIFDDSADSYERLICSLTNYNHTYDILAGMLAPESEILDLACGTANISRYLKKLDTSLRFTGVDLSKEMLGNAKTFLPDERFIVADVSDFRGESEFDAVIAGFALPFLCSDEIGSFFENVHRNLKTGGIFYLSFMEGTTAEFEFTSFCPDEELFITYHPKENVTQLLRDTRFTILHEWQLDFTEQNGSITNDIVIICRKMSENKRGDNG